MEPEDLKKALTAAQEALRATPTPLLLRSAYRLTHQMHEQPNAELRAQRDMIDAEILRRTMASA